MAVEKGKQQNLNRGEKKKEKYLFDLLSDGSSQSERSPRSSCRLDSIDLENIQIIKLYDSQKQHTHTHMAI